MRGIFFAAVAALGFTAQAAHASWYDFVMAQKRHAESTQIDWAAYYKGGGYPIPVDAQDNPQRIHFVGIHFPQPGQMQWAVPNPALLGPLPPQMQWAVPYGAYPVSGSGNPYPYGYPPSYGTLPE